MLDGPNIEESTADSIESSLHSYVTNDTSTDSDSTNYDDDDYSNCEAPLHPCGEDGRKPEKEHYRHLHHLLYIILPLVQCPRR